MILITNASNVHVEMEDDSEHSVTKQNAALKIQRGVMI
jgi:hypothetical protein